MAQISEGFTLRPFDLVLTVTENTPSPANIAANQSVVSWTLKLDPTSNYESWSANSGDNTYSVWINGVKIDGNYTFDFRTNTTSNRTIGSGTKTIDHEPNGSKTITIDASSSSVVLGSSTPSAGSLVLTDFVRLPSAPAEPEAVLAADRSKITITSGIAESPVLPSEYEMRYSTNNGSTWTPTDTGTAMGTDRVYDLSPITVGATYIFQTRAVSSEGNGPWSASSTGVYVKPAGRRYDGTAWVAATTARRYNGTAWVDVTVFRRYNGTAWVDIS